MGGKDTWVIGHIFNNILAKEKKEVITKKKPEVIKKVNVKKKIIVRKQVKAREKAKMRKSQKHTGIQIFCRNCMIMKPLMKN